MAVKTFIGHPEDRWLALLIAARHMVQHKNVEALNLLREQVEYFGPKKEQEEVDENP